MGQTLTHGVYLPDEGERNCYSGLAGNWNILDGAVGTIAEHTTALAGKAPAVHTHTKSDITDFPAYGNAAGTICEGNDSRLSDARTPVAHTHTKSDVTDLLNSNFIPSANNSYDLGSSSYQWNNVYSKGYYYNGVAWGLDKANVWSANNEFKAILGLGNYGELWFKNRYIDDFTTNPQTYVSKSILQTWNKDNTQYSGGLIDYQMADGTHTLEIVCYGYPLNDTTAYQHRFRFDAYRDGGASFHPTYNNAGLGTSLNRWKSFNGVNPGALSLPNTPGGTGTVNVNYYDLSGDITIKDGSGENIFTASCDGWIAIGSFASWLQVSNDTLLIATTGNPGADGFAQVFLPVRKGNSIRIVINQTNTLFQSFKLLPCEGNV